MRTVRSSSRLLGGGVVSAKRGVCPGECLPGGCLPRWWGVCPGGVCPGGTSAQGVSPQGGVYPERGGVFLHALGQATPHHPLCEQNDWQTGVKILPFRNFVCGR